MAHSQSGHGPGPSLSRFIFPVHLIFPVQDWAGPPGRGPEKYPGNGENLYKTCCSLTFLIISGDQDRTARDQKKITLSPCVI